jgi:ferredoxin
MFAREEYSAGTARYDEYYAKHPQKKDIDDRLRKLPGLLEHGGRYYVPDRARQIKAVFRSIQALTTQVDGDINAVKESMDPSAATAHVKELVARLGADEVGIARLNRMFVYSHVGRGPEPWGKPIELNHDFAIAFTLEMSYDQVRKAPDLPITEETARQYLRAATISVTLARYLRNLGYPARAHISDSNYQIMLPPVAADAGLGEMSRMGYLISPKYGARVRLGAVTTNLPLIPGQVEPFGVQEFCDVCRKCARNCPSAAIPQGDKTEVRGALMWHLNAEQCLRYWRQVGTDCGLCMRVCPYSHPPTFVHNIVRAGIRHSAFARHVSVWGDDFFYGRRVHLNQW